MCIYILLQLLCLHVHVHVHLNTRVPCTSIWTSTCTCTYTCTCNSKDCNWQHVLYVQQLKNPRNAIKAIRRGKLKSGVLLLQDNAPSQNSDVSSKAWLWNCSVSPLFFWFSTLRLLFVSENVITTTEVIWKQQWCHGGCWRLMGANFSLPYRRDCKTWISWTNVYRCLCWKITEL